MTTPISPVAVTRGKSGEQASGDILTRWRLTRGWRRHTRAVLIANLVGQIGIVVTGGAVRLTGSGLGCDQWPMCEPGSFTPRFHEATSIHPYIEFGNRTLSAVLLVLGLAVLTLVATDRSRSASYRRLGYAPLAGVLAQAVIGGVVVLLDLAPGWVALHYLVSAGLVWVSTYVLYRHGEGDGVPRAVVPGAVARVGWAVAVALLPVLTLGVLVTGSGPHGGDDLVASRFAFDPVVITRMHAGAVWLFVGLVVALAVLVWRGGPAGGPGGLGGSARGLEGGGPKGSGGAVGGSAGGRGGSAGRRAPARTRRAVVVLIAVTAAQGTIGYVQYFTGLPELLVGLHMLGSALLIAATTWTVLTLRARA